MQAHQRWIDRFKKSFQRAIRNEGKFLYESDAVTLREVTETSLRAHVEDEDVGEVYIEIKKNGVSASCDCRIWHEGFPCPHMWAVMLAADEHSNRIAPQGKPPRTLSLPCAAPGAQEEDKNEAHSPQRGNTTLAPWHALLFPKQSACEGSYHSGSNEYMIRYDIRIASHRVSLGAVRHRLLKSGRLGQPARVGRETLSDLALPAADRHILELMLGAHLRAEISGRGYLYNINWDIFKDFRPDLSVLSALLPLLAETGRCAVFISNEEVTPALRTGGLARLEWAGEAGRGAHKSTVVCRAGLRLGETVADVDSVMAFFNTLPVMFVHNGVLYSLPGVDYNWVLSMRRCKGVVRVPRNNVEELVQAVLEDSGGENFVLPPDIMPARRNVMEIRPCLELIVEQSGFRAEVWFDYEGREVSWVDPRKTLLDTQNWIMTERDPVREDALLQSLQDVGINMRREHFAIDDGLWEQVDVLAAQGWIVRGTDKRRIHSGRLRQLRVSGSGRDWFELDGGVDFDGVVVPLPVAVRAYLRGERIVELSNGASGILPRAWFEQHARILELGETGRKQDGVLRFHSAHVQLLDGLLDECPDPPREFLALRAAFKAFSGVKLPSPPMGLQGTLRTYQREALGWFDFLAEFGFGGILADDMGLGKTIQALAWMLLLKERGVDGPNLVVGPTSLLFNWRDEAARFAPGLRVLTYAGQEREGLKSQFQEHDVILTTYGLLRRDVDVLRQVTWTCIILDESQAIKNPDAQTAKAARVLQGGHRLCLSGTPLENSLGELWSQMQFLNPGLLGSRKSFESRFARPLAQGDTQPQELLQRFLKPFLLRRTKDAVADDLPDKQETVVHCVMTEAQEQVYRRLHDHYRSEILAAVNEKGLERSQMKVLEGLLRLRQAACHPALVGEKDAASGKLEELIRMVDDVVREGHKALIFSQFTRFLELIRKALHAAGIMHEYLDGRTPPKTREKRVASFQGENGPPVFCISLRAGGVGLNLTAADYVFIMDPWWNPAVESQAVNRAHRIGQNKNVFAYRLISQDSIDEKVLTLQQEKKDLADALLDGATTAIGALTKEDLERLLE